jgi:hypothetical protein
MGKAGHHDPFSLLVKMVVCPAAGAALTGLARHGTARSYQRNAAAQLPARSNGRVQGQRVAEETGARS